MTTHLATRRWILCHTEARSPVGSGDLRDVTCSRCLRRFDQEMDEEWGEVVERRYLDRATEAAEFLGAGFLWSLVVNAETAADRLTKGILAAVFIGLAEQYRMERAA